LEAVVTAAEEDPVLALGDALAQVDARPKINRARIVRSTLHDANYHVAIIACAMRMHSEPESSRRILAAWLKLLQFVAARPALVENLLEYWRTRRKRDLEKWSLMPRGYMGDKTHDGVIDFLAAAGILSRDGDYLGAGPRFDVLERIAAQVEAEKLFAGERHILDRLREMRPTKVLLGGA
jgi:hypothetical protein